MAHKVSVPHFVSEAEEAQWWYDHRKELAKAFEGAAARGELHTSSAAKLVRQRTAAMTPTYDHPTRPGGYFTSAGAGLSTRLTILNLSQNAASRGSGRRRTEGG